MDAAPPAPRAADAPVLAVVVARGSAPELEAVLAGLAAQDHQRLEVAVVEVPYGPGDPTPEEFVAAVPDRVSALFPGSTVVSAPSGTGQAAAVAMVLAARPEMTTGGFLLLMPGGVVLGDTVVRRLVERAIGINAGVVGPKVVDPDGSLVETGWRLDRLCSPVPVVGHPEPDQGQHDADLVPLAVAGSVWMVRADLYAELGGLDPEGGDLDGSVEFCLRARRAGATVAVVPGATARRLTPLEWDETRRSRLRVRLLLTGHGRSAAVLAPPLLAASLLGMVYGLVVGRFRHAWGLLVAWPWNVRRLASARRLRHRSSEAALIRPVEPVAVPHHAFRRVVTGRELAAGREGSTWEHHLQALFAAVFGPGGLALLVAAAIVGFGSRSLLAGGVVPVGRIRDLPVEPWGLVASWWSGWRIGGTGTELVGPDGLALLGVLASVWPGSTGSWWTLVVLGSVAVGAAGVWRLVRPLGGGRSRAVAVLVYLAVPLPWEALREGGLSTLAAYAVVPWVVRRLAGAQGMAPYGGRGGDPGPGTRVRDLWSEVVVTGVVLAAVVAVDPLLVVPTVVVLVGLLSGTLLAGRVDGLGRLLLVSAGGGLLASVVHLPLVADLLRGRDPATLGSGAGSPREGVGIRDVLGLDVGATGRTAAAALFILPILALVATTGRHLGVVVRAWLVTASAAVLLVAMDQGWLGAPDGPVGMVEAEAILVVVAVGMAWASAAGAAGLGEAVNRGSSAVGSPMASLVSARLARWTRSALLGVVAVALGVGALPVVVGSLDGAWGAPRIDLVDALPEVWSPSVDGEQRLGGDARILWLGDSRVVPVSGLPFGRSSSASAGGMDLPAGTILAVTDGRPDLADQWSPGATTGLKEMSEAVGRAVTGDLHRLGAELGRWGVARIVLVERSAPVPEPAVERPAGKALVAALARQLDLERVPAANGAVTVYRNTEVEAPFSVVRDGNRRVVPARVERLDLGHRVVSVSVDGALRWMHGPNDRWVPSVDERESVVLPAGAKTGVVDRPSVRVAGGYEVALTLSDGRQRGLRRFQVAVAAGLLLLASWSRTGRRARAGMAR
ncbi:MAG: glycosyltransferase [Actinomycetota bacterium]|nr:glycosyltransferase [Actinomycetota bacterium]